MSGNQLELTSVAVVSKSLLTGQECSHSRQGWVTSGGPSSTTSLVSSGVKCKLINPVLGLLSYALIVLLFKYTSVPASTPPQLQGHVDERTHVSFF